MVTCINAFFSFIVLTPTVGFDDANITLNYAENIAAGHGYVYNIGGERVEGSTSPAWTAINTGAYLLPISPEITLAGLGFLIACVTIWLSMLYGEAAFRIAGQRAGIASLLVGLGFLALPSYFGWAIWSLMDFGFWVLLITGLFWLSASILYGEGTRIRLVLLAVTTALVTATRPEGIAVAFGFAALLALLGATRLAETRSLRPALIVLLAGAMSYGILAAIRLVYFGDLFPNTYYSKVSTDYFSQFIQGAHYLKSFLTFPPGAAIVLLAISMPFLMRHKKTWPKLRRFWLFTMLATFGGMLLYVLIGGDHFGSFRFFLFVYPALLPIASMTLYALWRKLPVEMRSPWAPRLTAGILLSVTSFFFAIHKGDYERELRIAEQGRQMGEILNTYPGKPSIGVIAAGGVAMTYEGHIYDLMGLNWVAMAKADRDQTIPYINHGGFSKRVFYDALPEIVHPQFGSCDRVSYDNNPFFGKVLRWVMKDDAFQSLYAFECFQGLRFYRLVQQ